MNAFNNLLCETDWNSLNSKDADAAYDEFLQKYAKLYNKSFLPRLCRGKKLKTLPVTLGYPKDSDNPLLQSQDFKKTILKKT